MTLTTHAIVGAAAASILPFNPLVAFCAGFASHLAIDAIPHWDYVDFLPSLQQNEGDPLINHTVSFTSKAFVRDFFVVLGDAVLGVALSVLVFSFWLFHVPLAIVLVGAVAGILPDPLQVLYWKTRAKILEPLQRLHVWVQKGKQLQHLKPWMGLGLQCALIVVVIASLRLLSLTP